MTGSVYEGFCALLRSAAVDLLGMKGDDTLLASRERESDAQRRLFKVTWDPTGDLLTYRTPALTSSFEQHLVRADGTGDITLPAGSTAWSSAADLLLISVKDDGGESTLRILERAGQTLTEFDTGELSGFRWVDDDRWIVYWTSGVLRVRRRDGSDPRLLWAGAYVFVP